MRRAVVLLVAILAIPVAATGADAGPVPPAVYNSQVLVRFAPSTPPAAASSLLTELGAVRVGRVYGTDVLVVRAPAAPDELVRQLDGSPLVDYAEPDAIMRLFLSNPNDPRFGEQYAHTRMSSVTGWSSYPGAYTSTGGPLIAVIDTGIDTNHEDLVGRIDTSKSGCFLGSLLCLFSGFEDDNGHGTHVSGIAAATTNNGKGVAGVAFNTTIIALKVCDLTGSCPTSAVAGALRAARDRGAKVANMSLGGPGNSATLQSAVQYAAAGGVVLVAAAGNDGNSTLSYPAAYAEVISVAATDSNDNRASFSQQNADVELAAPGVNVLSSYNTGGYTNLSGTSMASPHVAGLAALLRGQNPSWTSTQVRNRMTSCADDKGAAGRDNQYGFGRINLARALGTC